MTPDQDHFTKYAQSIADAATVHAAIASVQSTPGMAYDTQADHDRRGCIAVNVWQGRPAFEGIS